VSAERRRAPPGRRRSRFRSASLALAALLAAAPAAAQPAPAPGYELLAGDGLWIEHTSASRRNAERLAALFETARGRVVERLGVPLPERVHAVVAATEAEFERRFRRVAGRPPGAGVLAVAFADLDLLIVRQTRLAEGTEGGLLPTLTHELSHLALGEVERRRGARLPRWLNEGLSEWAAGRRPTGKELAQLRAWAKLGQMPRLATLSATFPEHGAATQHAYTVAMAFVSWLAERAPPADLVAALEVHADADAAFVALLGEDATLAEVGWLVELADDHSVWASLLWSIELWMLIALLAVVAAVRQWFRRRALMRELIAQDEAEGAARAAAQRGDDPPGAEPP